MEKYNKLVTERIDYSVHKSDVAEGKEEIISLISEIIRETKLLQRLEVGINYIEYSYWAYRENSKEA